MPEYTVSVPVRADTPAEAARALIDALGADEHSINDIGGVRVDPASDDPPVLVCRGCNEIFETIATAHDHGVYIPGPDPSWCGEAGFDITVKEIQ